MTDPPRVTPAEVQRRALRGSAWTALHATTAIPLAFLANAVIARQLGSAGYGSLALLTAILGVVGPATNLGVAGAVIQWGSGYWGTGDRDRELLLLRQSQFFHVLVQLPVLVVVLAVLGREAPVAAVLLLVGSTVLQAVAGGAVLSLSTSNRMDVGARVAMVSELLVQLSTASVALATADPVLVWGTRLTVVALTTLLHLPFVEADVRRILLRPKVPRALPAGLLRFAALTWAAGLVGSLVYSRSEVFLLEAFSTPEALGVFALAFGLAQQVKAPVDAVLGPLLPAVSALLSRNAEAASDAFLRALRVSALLAAVVLAVGVPLLVFLLPVVYGPDFERTSWLFLGLAVPSCLQAALHPVTAFLYGRRLGSLILRANLAALVVNVALGLALIPSLGAWGAVLANASGFLVVLSVLTVYETRAQGVPLRVVLDGCTSFWLSSGALAAAVLVGSAVEARGLGGVPAAVAATSTGALALLLLLRVRGTGIDAASVDALVRVLPGPSRRPAARLLRSTSGRR